MGVIKVEPSAEMRLALFHTQNTVERQMWRSRAGEHVLVWLKNGYGVKLTSNGVFTDMTTVKRAHTVGDVPFTPDNMDPAAGWWFDQNVTTQEVLDRLLFLHTLSPHLKRDTRMVTMGQITHTLSAQGHEFVSDKLRRDTQQSLARNVFPTFGPAGTYFISGEIVQPGERRKYTVRRAFWQMTDHQGPRVYVEDASEFREFGTVGGAGVTARSLAQKMRDRYSFVG